MKKHLAILFVFIHLSCFAQNNVSPTDPNNELSLYLKENVSKKLLRKTSYYPNAFIVRASFCVDKNDEIYNFKTTTTNKALNDALRDAFENYPIEKLIPSNRNQAKKYSLDVISKKGSKNIFDCSNQLSEETTYLSKNCQKFEQYPDKKKCFSEEVKEHFMCNLDQELLFTKNTSSTKINFTVTNHGRLIQKKRSKKTGNSPEADRIIKLFTPRIIPATLNGKPVANTGSFTISRLDVETDTICSFASFGSTPTFDSLFSIGNYSRPSQTNDLALFIKERLPKDLLNRANLNEINNSLVIHFSTDTKKKYTNVSTNARSKILGDTLISIFKQYPFDLFAIDNQKPMNRYYVQLLSYESNSTIVNASSDVYYESLPIYKGCENMNSLDEGKKCFSKKISLHFNKKFNSGLARSLELPAGRHRIYCMFKFSTNGEVTDIQVKAPHKVLKNEATRVIQMIPKLASPGIQKGRPVSVRYSLPISFMVSNNTATKNTNSRYKPSNVNF